MQNILQAGRHVIIGGVSGQFQSGIGRECLFHALVSDRRPTVIALTDARHEDALLRHFSVWAKARGKRVAKPPIFTSDALVSARDPDHFFSIVDRAWQGRPSPSPIFFRDAGGENYKADRWPSFAAELARSYNAPVLSVLNLGGHSLTSVPIKNIPADDHWECVDYGAQVRLKHLESDADIQFTSKAVDGGQIWTAEQRELAHA